MAFFSLSSYGIVGNFRKKGANLRTYAHKNCFMLLCAFATFGQFKMLYIKAEILRHENTQNSSWWKLPHVALSMPSVCCKTRCNWNSNSLCLCWKTLKSNNGFHVSFANCQQLGKEILFVHKFFTKIKQTGLFLKLIAWHGLSSNGVIHPESLRFFVDISLIEIGN